MYCSTRTQVLVIFLLSASAFVVHGNTNSTSSSHSSNSSSSPLANSTSPHSSIDSHKSPSAPPSATSSNNASNKTSSVTVKHSESSKTDYKAGNGSHTQHIKNESNLASAQTKKPDQNEHQTHASATHNRPLVLDHPSNSSLQPNKTGSNHQSTVNHNNGTAHPIHSKSASTNSTHKENRSEPHTESKRVVDHNDTIPTTPKPSPALISHHTTKHSVTTANHKASTSKPHDKSTRKVPHSGERKDKGKDSDFIVGFKLEFPSKQKSHSWTTSTKITTTTTTPTTTKPSTSTTKKTTNPTAPNSTSIKSTRKPDGEPRCVATAPRLNLHLHKMLGEWYPVKLSAMTAKLWSQSFQNATHHETNINDTHNCILINYTMEMQGESETLNVSLQTANETVTMEAIFVGDAKHPKTSKWALSWPNGEDTLTSVVAAGIIGKSVTRYSWLLTVNCDLNGVVDPDWAIMARIPSGVSNEALSTILAIVEGLKGLVLENVVTFDMNDCRRHQNTKKL